MYADEYMVRESVDLLKKLIQTPSFSKEEHGTAALIETFFKDRNLPFRKYGNNIVSRNQYFNADLPTVLLNSHHDTVKPNKGYTRDPFKAELDGDKLYGLGSNDAGASLVALLAAYRHLFYRSDLFFNLVFAATAEEEISGKGGIESVLEKIYNPILGIVGEPTQMQLCVAEKGLMVLDATVKGQAGHAAREEGVNAIYIALEDILWFKDFNYPRISKNLGKVRQTVTICSAGSQHNVVPDTFTYTVDVRLTDAYSMEEILGIIRENVKAEIHPRSLRLKPSGLEANHFLFGIAQKMGLSTFGSPTLSDQAIMPFSTVKIGPGDSARSHTADEHVYVSEIQNGVATYLQLLEEINKHFRTKAT